MGQVKGIEGMSNEDINEALSQGARFVVFPYTVSILVMTFRRSSDVHFVRPGEGTLGKALPYTLITLLLGWWGIPWGPIYSVGSLYHNLTGGKDVTADMLGG